MQRIIETQQPNVALVIATFAGVPYVHLALESWHRNHPETPVLVHDDGSHHAETLHGLCRRYGAHFFSNPRRMRRTVGDLSAFLHGMEWASGLGSALLVKMSRRFIPLVNWVPELQQLAWFTQYATYSQRCRHFNFGFRTECIALHLPSWTGSPVFGELRAAVERNEPLFVEGYIHNLARQVHGTACEVNRQHEHLHPRQPDSNAYGIWMLMPDSRTSRCPRLLWHDCEDPVDYARAAQLYGLGYSADDFLDANQGGGLGQP